MCTGLSHEVIVTDGSCINEERIPFARREGEGTVTDF